MALLISALTARPARAVPLEDVIPNLFGGTLSTTVDQSLSTTTTTQTPRFVSRFQNLSAQLAAARSQVPIPSTSGAFSFAWDQDLDTFVRFEQDLGDGFGERAQTLGRHRFTAGFSYQYIHFNTLDGDPLNHLTSVQPAFSKQDLSNLPPEDQLVFGDDQLMTTLDLSFTFDLFYLSAAYGVTDNIDISLALAVNHASMEGSAFAMTLPGTNTARGKVARFTLNQPGALAEGGPPGCGPFRCAIDHFNQSATGTGDLYLRLKWHFADTWLADLAVAEVLTLPTGNANELLGFHDPTFTPWFIASKKFGPISPHVNLGYAFRSAQDVSQAQWIVGADLLLFDSLSLGADRLGWHDLAARLAAVNSGTFTFAADFLGYHDDKRDGVNDDVVQSAVGFKVNPWGGLVLNGSFQFPVNREGLRADVIYTGQIEYNF